MGQQFLLHSEVQAGHAEIGASILRILRGEYCCLAEIARYNLRKECVKYDLHSRTN